MTIRLTRRGALAGLTAFSLAGCTARKQAFEAQVVVIGAGLSGLYAAMLLEEQGKDVLVLEAEQRVGGRMFTIEHAEGLTEGGGQQIGASYARILDVASRLNVPLYEEKGRGPATAYYLNDAWQSAQDMNISDFPAAFQKTPPASVLFRLLAAEPGLESADAWMDAPEAMDISAAEFLSRRGFNGDGQALIERALNANRLETYSVLNLHRSLQIYKQSVDMGPTQYVEGGAQRLPEAMAASLNRPVQLGTFIQSITAKPDRVEIQAKGFARPLVAEHVICTIPFGGLRKMEKLSADLSRTQRDAISALPYTQILQFHGRFSDQYWDADGIAPSMWLDNPLERIFAGTDKNSDLTGFVRTWINGEGTKDWLESGDEAALKNCLDEIMTVRPELANTLDLTHVVNWTESNPLAGGAYMHWAPGQARRWAKDMGKPAGRLYFAGEHLSRLHTGMEGAMESGETTAFDLLNL